MRVIREYEVQILDLSDVLVQIASYQTLYAEKDYYAVLLDAMTRYADVGSGELGLELYLFRVVARTSSEGEDVYESVWGEYDDYNESDILFGPIQGIVHERDVTIHEDMG